MYNIGACAGPACGDGQWQGRAEHGRVLRARRRHRPYRHHQMADMEKVMEQEVPEGGEPKNVAAVVADILTKECPSNTFLQNVGLESSSKMKFNRSAVTLDAHVQELE